MDTIWYNTHCTEFLFCCRDCSVICIIIIYCVSGYLCVMKCTEKKETAVSRSVEGQSFPSNDEM